MNTEGKNPIEIMNEMLRQPSVEVSAGEPNTDVVDNTEEQSSEDTTSTTEQNDVEVVTEEGAEKQPEPEQTEETGKKENAFKAISEKLKQAKQEAADAKANEEKLFERLAKVMKVDKSEIKAALEQEEAAAEGLTPEAARKFKEMEEKLNSFQAKDTDAKWEDAVNKLITVGKDINASEEDITSFIIAQKAAGNDFVKSPDADKMLKLFKAEHADKFIQSEVQKALKAKKSVVVENAQKSSTNVSTQNDDALMKAMLSYVQKK